MPENRCELVFIQSGELPSTKPLRVITQYSSADDLNMQSPGRPTSLGVCLTALQNPKDGKGGSSASRVPGMEESSQSWSAKMVDNADFEKLLGHLGSNGSTPVTPTSFLNPRNITEDQEIFADNFSRTLNKVKAEQEGWTTAEFDRNNGSLLRPHSHSPPNTSLRATASAFGNVRCSTTELIPPQSNTDQTPCSDQTSHSSNRIDPGSPRLTDPPLVLSSATSLSSALPHLRTAPVSTYDAGLTHSSSKGLSPSTDFDLNHSATRTLDSTSTTWTTGLPTILSIASSLKDVCADRRLLDHGNPEHSHLIHSSDLPITLQAPSSPPPTHSSHPSAQRSLFTLDGRNGANGDLNPRGSSPSMLLRYSIPDTTRVETVSSSIGSVASYHSNGTNNDDRHNGRMTNNGVGGQNNRTKDHTSPPTVCPSLQNINFSRDEIYPGSDSSSLTSSLGLLPSILSTAASSAPSPLGLSTSAGKPPSVAFLLTSTATTAVSASSNQGHLICSSNGKQSYVRMPTGSTTSSTVTGSSLSNDINLSRLTPVSTSTLSTMNILQDSDTGTLLINSGSQLQQLTALYPSLNGTLDVTTTDDMQPNFVFHPNLNGDSGVPLSFGTHLTTGLSESSSFLGNSQVTTSITNTSADRCTTDLMRPDTANGSVLCPGVPFSRMGPGVGPSESSTPESMANMLTDTSTSSHLPSFSSLQPSSTGSSKKTKRSGKKSRACRGSNEVPSPVNQSKVPPPLGDNGSGPNAYVNPSPFPSDVQKSGSKRGRESCDTGQLNPIIFHPVQSLRDTVSYPPAPLPGGQVLYMTDSDHAILIKPEAHGGETMDDGSTQSESVSADTVGGTQGQGGCGVTNASGQTPPSSVDELDQHSLKLERKRARNRVAARRCRERKITLIRALENQVAERDAYARCLQDQVARYQSGLEQLRKHLEMLSNSYPTLKAELYRCPLLFQPPTQIQPTSNPSTTEQQSGLTQSNNTEIPECVSSKHFS